MNRTKSGAFGVRADAKKWKKVARKDERTLNDAPLVSRGNDGDGRSGTCLAKALRRVAPQVAENERRRPNLGIN